MIVSDASKPRGLMDGFGRRVSYLRLSVTDRCDLRCIYCMSETMKFAPKRDILSVDDLDRIARAFIRLGVRKLRITGGEPLVRKDIMALFLSLSGALKDGSLEELTLTTNGTRLAQHAEGLARAGVKRLNVSLDTLDPESFRVLSRGGSLTSVLDGIAAARAIGLEVKLNVVALRGYTESGIDDLIRYAHGNGMALTLIETMPLGDVGVDRIEYYLPLDTLRRSIERRWSLTDIPLRTGGPACYARVDETGGVIGFITPMTRNFCESCNRVRVTAAGVLHACLGQEDAVQLTDLLKRFCSEADLEREIARGIAGKARGHDFVLAKPGDGAPLARHMSATGG